MAVARTPRETWIDEGFRTLATGGPDAIRIEALAKRLHTTKGSFYWHFEDRNAFLTTLLDQWEATTVDSVIAEVESASGDARARLSRLFEIALTTVTPTYLASELAIREWARRDEGVAARLRGVDNRRMDFMRGLFGAFVSDKSDVEARCFIVYTLFVGSRFVVCEHGGQRRIDVLRNSLALLLN